jgi:2-oxoglutarate ferredoxin oxidoreductase subunit gamma
VEKIGKPIVFNICVLGALIGLKPLVREESLLAAISDRVPAEFVGLNSDAFNLGLELGREYALATI